MKAIELSLRNRIAISYLLLASSLILVVFFVVYGVVQKTVYNHLDEDLDTEIEELKHGLVVLNDSFIISNPYEWTEKEHKQIEVNPVFIELTDMEGVIFKKSSNLRNGFLTFNSGYVKQTYYNTKLVKAAVRQLQYPVSNPLGKTLGYLIVAIPFDESDMVLSNLRMVLIVAFPLVLLILFFATRLIAGRSIAPVAIIIESADKITRENLADRIPLPPNRDELYKLATTINELLNRLEDAINREKQFTSDASHELRTPISTLKGTLEVLIRKPREVEHYEGKVRYCISEVDRMASLVERLLMLARFDSMNIHPKTEQINTHDMINSIIISMSSEIDYSRCSVVNNISSSSYVSGDRSLLEIIFRNLLSNSLKYSPNESLIEFESHFRNNETVITLVDNGYGMTDDQLDKIHNRFYRAEESRDRNIQGVGLGMSIVKKLCDLLQINLQMESSKAAGTKIFITIKTAS